MATKSRRRWVPADYTIACICPMGVELAPVEGMLDEIHDPLQTKREKNAYTLGTIGGHNIVIAIMPEIGNNAAATTVTQLLNDFPAVRFGLLVGIGGGVPGDADVRLGDLVVGQPVDEFPGVVQYDLGKELGDGQFQRTGSLDKPPAVLSAHVRKLDGQHRRLGHSLLEHISEMFQKYPKMQTAYSMPVTAAPDRLFVTTYKHQKGPTCDQCDDHHIVPRPARPNNEPKIHYGTIGSANKVVKDADLREKIRRDVRAICIEMEAAGLMNDFPCLVIRGICDYADSHKNKEWQPYAAAIAAAYMKALLLTLPGQEVSLAGHAIEHTASPFKVGLCLVEAPVIEDELFIGRFTELDEMEKLLQPYSPAQKHYRLVLGGMGGIGKTQLTIAYAKQYCHSYDSIFWLNATSEADLKYSIRLLAQRVLDVEQHQGLDDDLLLLHIIRWLSNLENTRWLLIFDNYDEPDAYDIRKYCPYGAHGSAIITSRFPDQVQGQPLLIRPLEEIEQSLEILATRSKRANVMTDPHARDLAGRMQGLPLALATAGAYLQKSSWSFEEYLKEYEKRWNISPRRPLSLREYQNRTLYTTWDVSYRRLEKEDSDAAQLLKLLAYFDNQHIWWDLLHRGIKDDSPRWLMNTIGDSASFQDVMRVLIDYCFVELQSATHTYGIHACVHDWALAGLNGHVDLYNYWFVADCIANSIIDVGFHSLVHLQYARLALHAKRLTCERFREVRSNMSPDRFEQVSFIATLLCAHDRPEDAVVMQEQVLTGCENLLGSEHIETLNMVYGLGIIYHGLGTLEEAEQMLSRALAGYEKALGPEHSSTLDTVNNLGVLYEGQGRLEEAEQVYIRALAGYKKVLGPEHSSTLDTVNNLGVLYERQGRLEEAEQMFIRALAGQEKALGPEHSSTLDTVNNLGVLYERQGRLEEAEQMFIRALAGQEKALGPEHSSTLDTVNNLGVLYEKQGRLEEAEQMFIRALAGKEKVLRPEHSSTLQTLNNVGAVYERQGRLEEAEQMYARALAGKEKALGPKHESTLWTVSNLRSLYRKQGRSTEGDEKCQKHQPT